MFLLLVKNAPEGWQRTPPFVPTPCLCPWWRPRYSTLCAGTPARHSETERSLVCPSWGSTFYPVIAPCVLVAVTCGNKLLLTRYAKSGSTRFVLVAGFVKAGENAEQAAAREVMEEADLRIKNMRYAGSQPRGLSGTLATGFFAELDGPDTIRLDTSELAEARWVDRADIPPCPDLSSLTMIMIDRFAWGEA